MTSSEITDRVIRAHRARKIRAAVSVGAGIAGLAILWSYGSWQLALGVFLVWWSINLDDR